MVPAVSVRIRLSFVVTCGVRPVLRWYLWYPRPVRAPNHILIVIPASVRWHQLLYLCRRSSLFRTSSVTKQGGKRIHGKSIYADEEQHCKLSTSVDRHSDVTFGIFAIDTSKH